MKKDVILFLTHKIDQKIIQKAEKLYYEINFDNLDFYILYNSYKVEKFGSIPTDKVFIFNRHNVSNDSLGMHYHYIMPNNQQDFYGHNIELSFITFFKKFPNYQNYWICEYDVAYNGNWNNFFKNFENDETDFLATHIEDVYVGHGWFDWNIKYSTNRFTTCPGDIFMKSFNPLCRLSNKLLKSMLFAYEAGDYGFYEIWLPTFVKRKGYTYKDLFDYNVGNKETFCFRYEKQPPMIPNYIYHPIK